ncbi:murein L,D-transpeptidase catalytic domain family protein [Thaumasiovibrio subtropicus]|uniref:murein L,D-transpeptidase catalytic domain family protein n=1 Tax=Thaumasiovibrio subtropicus TaxID=1891207 RepID=UPI000B363275|nr:murein L,D-transpeptidase catalytic domain family protein [Thaumasiovibrio subtropicus]
MKHLITHLGLLLTLSLTTIGCVTTSQASYIDDQSTVSISATYNTLDLHGKLDYAVFMKALRAYNEVENVENPYLTIIDYTKPSSEKRFFVIDMQNMEVVYNTLVAHGKNSGTEYATDFSNTVNSKKTSLGVFLTDTTYDGSNGYSLRLDGLTPGLNDNARQRYIVVHGADYAEEDFLASNGQLGRSWGCPAVPNTVAREVIDTIKGGSVIFAHG